VDVALEMLVSNPPPPIPAVRDQSADAEPIAARQV